jgi:hypothetical protein
MAIRALLLALAGTLFADATPQRIDDPVLPVEKLGRHFQSKGAEEDRGIRVSIWRNETLDRDERWHCNDNGEWFYRARPGIFVLTGNEPEGGWTTRPLERLVWRYKAWRRISLEKKK